MRTVTPKRLSFLFFSSSLLFCSAPYALSPFEADYSVAFGFIDLGEAKMEFKQIADNEYTLSFVAKTSGLTHFLYPYSLKEVSQLERTEDRSLRSTGYFYEEKKDGELEKQRHIKINNRAMKAWQINHKEPKEWQLKTSLPTDKLSFAFIIGDDIENDKKIRSPITILDGSKVRAIEVKELTEKPHDYNIKEENSPFKRDDYQNYRRFYLEDDNESMEVWLDKRKKHFPFKILFTSEGWTVYYELNKLKWKK